jgi:hypothetical protein
MTYRLIQVHRHTYVGYCIRHEDECLQVQLPVCENLPKNTPLEFGFATFVQDWFLLQPASVDVGELQESSFFLCQPLANGERWRIRQAEPTKAGHEDCRKTLYNEDPPPS